MVQELSGVSSYACNILKVNSSESRFCGARRRVWRMQTTHNRELSSREMNFFDLNFPQGGDHAGRKQNPAT
jgi:hypothetical protein